MLAIAGIAFLAFAAFLAVLIARVGRADLSTVIVLTLALAAYDLWRQLFRRPRR